MEKVDKAVGRFSISYKFKNVNDQFFLGFHRCLWSKFRLAETISVGGAVCSSQLVGYTLVCG